MKRTLTLITFILAGTALAFGQQPPAQRAQENPEEELRRINREWAETSVRRDLAAFDRIAADDFVFISPGGTVRTRAQERGDLESGLYQFEALDADDVQVRVYGDTAVVTGRATVRGRFGQEDISGRYRYMTVYVRRDGNWRAVAEQVTSIMEQPPTRPAQPAQPAQPAEPRTP